MFARANLLLIDVLALYFCCAVAQCDEIQPALKPEFNILKQLESLGGNNHSDDGVCR